MSPRLTAAVVAAALAVVGAPSPATALDEVDTRALRKAVTAEGILRHERALQNIANHNGGTRASGTSGYEHSRDYVRNVMTKAGYRELHSPGFPFDFFQELEPPVLEQSLPARDFSSSVAILTGSGSGDVRDGRIHAVNLTLPPTPKPSSNSGCSSGDFADFPAGSIALVQRGGCTFSAKAENAKAAGAVAVVIFNEGQKGEDGHEDRTGVVQGQLGRPIDTPVLGVPYAVGLEIAEAQTAKTALSIKTKTLSEQRTTSNLVFTSPGGNSNNAIVIGSHLDSVANGPGINDNGSGAATNIEIALQMSALKVDLRHELRFAFWGAEEAGLVGSKWYVDHLEGDEVAKIYANLNFDMLGSPNYGRFVIAPVKDELSPPGTLEITSMFERYFAGLGMGTEKSELDGRSDYAAFNEAGIPVGGLFTGAEKKMTVDLAELFGTGAVGKPFDSCYHKECDTITNLNVRALNEMGKAAAHGVMTLAVSEESLNSENAILSKPNVRGSGGGDAPNR